LKFIALDRNLQTLPNINDPIFEDENKEEPIEPLHPRNKYVTFSVSASKDFKVSMVKRFSGFNSERDDASSKIISLLNKGITEELSPADWYAELNEYFSLNNS
jgi:hypothetical protein